MSLIKQAREDGFHEINCTLGFIVMVNKDPEYVLKKGDLLVDNPRLIANGSRFEAMAAYGYVGNTLGEVGGKTAVRLFPKTSRQ